jgi:hypothetical protein
VLDHTPFPCGIWLLVAACGAAPTQGAGEAPAAPTRSDPPAATAPPAADLAKADPAKADPGAPRLKLAEVREDVPLPITRLLGMPPTEVEAQMGVVQAKGMVRESCVRFVPERTFFSCKYATQTYADKTGNFTTIRVGFEDGVATELAFTGWKHGVGPFDPLALLTAVGLTLPEPPVESAPEPNVKLWKWFNQRARLVIDGKQHRVEVSAVDGEWARGKLEILLNDPLTPEQKAKILAPKGGEISEPPAPAKNN